MSCGISSHPSILTTKPVIYPVSSTSSLAVVKPNQTPLSNAQQNAVACTLFHANPATLPATIPFSSIYSVSNNNNTVVAQDMSAAAAAVPDIPHLSTDYEADFVIVGAGPAGIVLAHRLSKKYSVIVIEAGGHASNDVAIKQSEKALELEMEHMNEYFWSNGESKPQEYVNNRTFDYTSGRVLGGSSSVNGMQYVRGSDHIYKQWQSIINDADWGPDNAHRIYQELENYHPVDNANKSVLSRGTNGPVDVRQAPAQPTTMATRFVTSIANITESPPILDYNNPNTAIGAFTRWQLFQNTDGTRESTVSAYLLDSSEHTVTTSKNGHYLVDKNRQLLIFLRATALRIHFDNKTPNNVSNIGNAALPRAMGVAVLHSGVYKNVYARQKVIISAGIMSPLILQRSGIGPASHLKKLGIPVVYDNPFVGQNLINHTMLPITAISSNMQQETGLPANDASALYVGGAFLYDPSKNADHNKRGLQLIGVSPEPGVLTILAVATQPKSRGIVQIISSDPMHEAPMVDYKYLEQEEDLNTWMASVEMIHDIVQQMGYQVSSFDPSILNDDQSMIEYIRENLQHTNHIVGTCKMAPQSKEGVVDSTGHVYGVRDLIVADTSVMPIPHDGDTVAPAMLIGHVIADKLLK